MKAKIQGNKIRLKVCLEVHLQDIGRFANDKVDFVAIENSYSTKKNSASIEQLFAATLAETLTIPRSRKFVADIFSQFHQYKRDAFSDRLALALAKGVPVVMLERWDAARAKFYQTLEGMREEQSHLAVLAFISGEVDTARSVSAWSATLRTFGVKARDAEMARNIARLGEIMAMPHFGLRERKPERGLAIIGAQHYSIAVLATNIQDSTTYISMHPKSLDYDVLKQMSYTSQLFENLKDMVKLPNTMASAYHQANNGLGSTYAALSDILLKSVFANLVLGLIPAPVLEELLLKPLPGIRLTHAVTSQLSPEALEELSRRLGEGRLVRGTEPYRLGEIQRQLRYAVNEFLSKNGLRTIPETTKEAKALAREISG